MWKVLFAKVPKSCSRAEMEDALFVHHGGQGLTSCLCYDLKVVGDGTSCSTSTWSAVDNTRPLHLNSYSVLAEYSSRTAAEEAIDGGALRVDGVPIQAQALFARSTDSLSTAAKPKQQPSSSSSVQAVGPGGSRAVVVRLSHVGAHCTVGEVYTKLTSCLQGAESSSLSTETTNNRSYCHITSLQPLTHPQGAWIVQFTCSSTASVPTAIEGLITPHCPGFRMLQEYGWSVMPIEGGSGSGGGAELQGKDLTVGGAIHRPYLYKQFRQPHLQEMPNRAYWDRFGNLVFDRHDLRGQQQQ